MAYYIVYRQKEIIDGPLPLARAKAICEDLDFALEDKGYRVVSQDDLATLGLNGEGLYDIQEDTPVAETPDRVAVPRGEVGDPR